MLSKFREKVQLEENVMEFKMGQRIQSSGLSQMPLHASKL